MKNLNFLVAAYVAIWAIFCLFLFSVARRMAGLQEEIRRLKDSGRDEPPSSRNVAKLSTTR